MRFALLTGAGLLVAGLALVAGAEPAAWRGGADLAQAQPAVQPAIADAGRLPSPAVAPPVNRSEPATVQVELETVEVAAQLATGQTYTAWTFNGTVPGPMVRVRQGDTVELVLKNAADSTVAHSIDLHAVTGPGGGAVKTQTAPGEQTSFRFRALRPGAYVYHCATPLVPHHIANGMYGLIVVEPPEGYAPVDREFYVMQGEFYLTGQRGQPGHHGFSMEKMLAEQPDLVVFNGSVGALTGERALRARVGERVRIFFGVGGPNLGASFHVIGEIMERVYVQGATPPVNDVQTTFVPPGGATMAEFTVEVPGSYTLVDHSLGRMVKGAVGILQVEGEPNPDVFE
ncbi:MAG: nitrite reductase, copper-containing [Chloroflexi bacterium]|nr:nitrite reductase, copper-containing [Chloroflexota bacterium]